MATIVYQTNKKTGVKYAYRSESYRDPITKQPRTHRAYLGIVDPITGDIIPKAESGKRNRLPKETATTSADSDNRITELLAQVDKLRTENFRLSQVILKIKVLLNSYTD